MNPQEPLMLGDTPIPGPVVLAYMVAFLAPCSPSQLSPLVEFTGSLKAMQDLKEARKVQAKRLMLPVVCGRCLHTLGYMEGGRLESHCWRCLHEPSTFWDKLGVVNALVSPDWAMDAIACIVINSINHARGTNNGRAIIV